MNKQEIITLIEHERDLYVQEEKVRIDEKLDAMKKGDLQEAIKYDRWLKDCVTITMELNYIIKKIKGKL